MHSLIATLLLITSTSALSNFQSRALAPVECAPGTYFHKHGSVDCAPSCPASGGTAAECCCACHADYYCPGGKKTQPELPCPPGTTSPPKSTSPADCAGGPGPGPAPPSAFEQVHVAYTGVPAVWSVDFVGGSGAIQVFTSIDAGNTWRAAPATSFAHPTIGYLSQAELDFRGVAPGARARYALGARNGTVFEVTPIVAARPEVFAVYADFGTANDVCMPALIAGAASGEFDAALHAGDWAYNFDDAGSSVGNAFMNDIQPFASVIPTMPIEGSFRFSSRFFLFLLFFFSLFFFSFFSFFPSKATTSAAAAARAFRARA